MTEMFYYTTGGRKTTKWLMIVLASVAGGALLLLALSMICYRCGTRARIHARTDALTRHKLTRTGKLSANVTSRQLTSSDLFHGYVGSMDNNMKPTPDLNIATGRREKDVRRLHM